MPVNSHIEVPDQIIKNFIHIEKEETEDGWKSVEKLFVYSFCESQINNINYKDYGWKFGYFNDEIEKLIQEKYETPFGDFKTEIFHFLSGKTESVVINKNKRLAAIKFLKSLYYRNMDLLKNLNDSPFFPFDKKLSPSELFLIMHKTDYGPVDDFNSFQLTVVKATGKVNFINCMSGFSIIFFGENDVYPKIFMPISPRGGILFFPQKEIKKFGILRFANDEIVREFNRRIFISEKITGKNSLFSFNLDDLKSCIQICVEKALNI